MPRTSCKAHMEFIDTSAIADSMAASSDNAAPGNLLLLKEEKEYPVYAIPDLNSFLLDGSREVMDGDTELPFLSSAVSGTDCTFTKNPMLTVDFTENHTSAGITLYFTDDYPEEIKVTWYDISGAVLISQTYHPDSLKFFCRRQVDNYGRITVEFVRTRRPEQRIQCRYIKYGTEIEWTGENIQSASINEEVDVTSATIPTNTASVTIIDEVDDFELSNQDGVWKSLQKKQKVTIKETVAGTEVPCGTFYIDTWESDGNIVTFTLTDMLGVIDRTKFYGGQVYEGESAGTIIASIMASAGVEDYAVSGEVAAIPLFGHLPICTHKEALQQVAFACGAVADCNRTGGIRIYLPDRYADSTIGTDRKFMGTTIELDEYVSGVSISYNRYSLAEEPEEAFSDTLPAGDSLIEFSEPYTGLTSSSGAILEAGANYVRVHMEEAGECIITGRKYESREITYTASVDRIEAGEEENILSYSGCTLVNADRVKAVAEGILHYYQPRQLVTMRYLTGSEKTGDWVNVMDARGNMVTSGITSQSIDLTGGFIAETVCRGYSKVTNDLAFAGEIYAGERGMI